MLNLIRYAITETPQAALSCAEHILQRDDTDAGKRLRHKLDFQGIWGAVCRPASPHPKMAKLIDIAKEIAGQKTLVLCTTRAGANELASALVPYAAQVFQLHGGSKGFESQFRDFSAVQSNAIAVATATHERKLGVVAGTIIHYNLVSADLQYVRELTPLPRVQSLLITVDHSLDLGQFSTGREYRPASVAQPCISAGGNKGMSSRETFSPTANPTPSDQQETAKAVSFFNPRSLI